MWQMIVDNIQSESESERLEQAEKNIKTLKETVAWLEKRIEKLEKMNDK